MGLNQVIRRINELFSTTKLGGLSLEDERALLRMAATEFHQARKRGEIREEPAFYLDAKEDGTMIIVTEGDPAGGHA
jgi:hypothetical protein